jgi:hypothetical protein
MNAVTLTGQQVHDIYVGGGGNAPAGPCLVVYALNQQNHVSDVCFHSTVNGMVLACFMLSDALTETEWLALRTLLETDPLYMHPIKVAAVDSALGIITCTGQAAGDCISAIDQQGYLHTIKQTDKLDRVCMIDLSAGGRVTLKMIISDATTETWWHDNVVSISVRVASLTFDVAA